MKKIIAIISIMIPLIAYGQNDLRSTLETYMDAQHNINDFGGVVIVKKNDSIIFEKAYGLADYDWDIKNTTDTKFVLASVTKQFTAAAILQLIEKGKLSLDDKLSRFFPDYPKGDSVTIHMLLSHSAGLDMGFKDLALTTISPDSAYVRIKNMPYVFSPGTSAAYSNIGYYLLARIIEKLSGGSYADYLKQNIFEKAGMKNSGACNWDSIVHHKAKIYYRTENGYNNNPYINWQITTGPDGVYSTVGDLALWDKALYSTTVLSEQMKKKMFTSYNDEHFGYGFMINPFYNHGHQLIAHDGGFMGTMTSLNRFTDDKVFIAVLSNNESPSHLLAYALSAIVFGKTVELPYRHTKVKTDSKLYDAYVGKYDNIKIIKTNDKLFFNNTDIELIPESETKFFRSDNNDRTIEFIKDNKGSVTSIIVTTVGVKDIKQRAGK